MLLLIILFGYLLYVECGKDRLVEFYERLNEPSVKYCSEKTKMLPDCNTCIPGMQLSTTDQSCSEFIPSSKSIREEIGDLVVKRFGDNMPRNRTFGLYPCKNIV
jgi:hypothetical protein